MGKHRADPVEDRVLADLDDPFEGDEPGNGKVVHVDDGEYGPTDDDDDEDPPTRPTGDDLWDASDEETDEDVPIAPRPNLDEILNKKPISEVFSPIALQGVSTKWRKKPLSTQSNDWIISTHRRLNGLLIDHPKSLEAPDWRDDVELLKQAGTRRGIAPEQLSEPIGGGAGAEVSAPAGKAGHPQSTGAGGPTVSSPSSRVKPAGDPGLVIVQVPLCEIAPDPAQARDEGADDELAESIKANGVLQPIELRRQLSGEVNLKPFMVVDGERRYRGAVKAGLEFIPATITDAAGQEGDRLIRQVVRNDGKRLKPMEEARTFKRIMADKGWTIQQLAAALGKPKSTVSDRVAIVDAPTGFIPLFEDGTLTAAAAPIARGLADVSPKVLDELLEFASQADEWERAVLDGKPVPLKEVESALFDAATENDNLRRLRKGEQASEQYRGPVATIGKERFAIDMKLFDKLYAAQEAAESKAKPASTAHAAPPPKPVVHKPSAYQLAERKKIADRKKKMALRRAQVVAIAPKLPATLDAKWGLFLVRHLIDEISNDTAREACKLLNLTPVKSGTYGGFTFDKTLVKHAESLKGPGLVPMALQILLASELSIPTYSSAGPKRIPAAADLAKVDLKKVKLVDPASTKPAFNLTAGSSPARLKGKPDFMQPFVVSAQLEAVVGKGPMVRTEVTKKLWNYIKRNNLQDPKERRMIVADDKMKPVFGGKGRVSMFEMTKLINKHLKR